MFFKRGGELTEEQKKAAEECKDDPVHIRVREVVKSYGEHTVLNGITFDIYRGEINIIIGGSGAGKSVFTRQLLRLEQPDSGKILVDGTDILPLNDWQLVPFRKKFGMVFQFGALFDSMTIFDNVAFPLREHTKMSRKEIHERVFQRLEDLRVADAAYKLPGQISGGMQKRSALARALVLEPEILVYDEPTSGLDPLSSRRVDELIRETSEKFGVTSLIITHDMASVFEIGTQVNMLYQGRIEASGTPDDILRSHNPVVIDFLRASGVSASEIEHAGLPAGRVSYPPGAD
ncbi:MAG TPA: ABC transporter ATP-binding protein [Sandaracinaceae bacterium LLY-WYZ-13_1]|nr:ABC transporter ATP-binding protein [Sandaracinaceae bacterium LLY-WYZ-13_1]